MAELHHTLVNKVVLTPSGCMEWKFHKGTGGYGNIRVHRKSKRAHRVSYERSIGPIPKGLFVLHRCDNPPCINPDHLFLGTHTDNVQDCIDKGRWTNGEKNGMSKLTSELVLKIRADERGLQTVADEYQISRSLVSQIRTRAIWKHLP